MTDNPFKWIRENHIELDSRDEKIREKEYNLSLRIAKQNERFEKLRKGYKKLGLITDNDDRNQTPMTRDRFRMESEQLQKRFNSINARPRAKEEMYNAQKELEKYLADMMTLSTERWNTICAYKELWRKERIEFRQEELNLQPDYVDHVKEETNSTNTVWDERTNKVFAKNKILIEEQKKKIDGEEELQKELETLFEFREQLFRLAEKLFMI